MRSVELDNAVKGILFMPKFPSSSELKQLRRQAARANGSKTPPKDVTAVERAKYDACEQMIVYMRKKNLTQRQLATELSTSETRISEIVHYRVDKFSLDRLLSLLQILRPDISVRIA